MVLGELTKCWICWESKAYSEHNSNLKQICSPYRAKKNSVCEGMIAWICFECRGKLK